MLRLMLLRHAKSDSPEPPIRDHDRPLNGRGRDAAPKIGAYMRQHGLGPDLVLCSTATRARQTLDLLALNGPPIVYDARLYGADPQTLLAVVQEAPRKARTLLLVGHNPGLQAFAGLLAGKGNRKMRASLNEKFPTGALAVFDLPLDTWRKVAPRSGRLALVVTPKSLESLSE